MRTLKQIVHTPLSMEDVNRLAPPGTPVILYERFRLLTTLPPVCIYLFLTSYGYGHYCCVIRQGSVVQFFDSYGIRPESEHQFVQPEMLDHLKESQNLILRNPRTSS